MKINLTAVLACLMCLGAAYAQEHFNLDPKLKLLQSNRPGLIGYLGDPAAGIPGPDRNLCWLKSGLILSEGIREYASLRVWSSKTGDVRFVGTLNASGRWAVSPDGQLLCSQVPKMEDDPLKRKGERLQPHALVCHRLSDKQRLWKWNPGALLIRDVAFSPEGQQIAVTVLDATQLIVCLLNASSGEEEQRITLPGVHARVNSGPGTLVYQKDAIWILSGREKSDQLLRVWRADLKPEYVPLEFLNENYAYSIHFSQDENWLALVGGYSYQVYQRDGASWKPAFSGDASFAGDMGSVISEALFSPDSRLLFVSTRQGSKVISLPSGKDLKSIPLGCVQAAFSPRGELMLLAHESGFTKLATQNWTPISSKADTLHQGPILSMHFLDDGKRLLANDNGAKIIWDLASRSASAILQSEHGDPHNSVPALVNNNTELIASDGRNFVRWTLPPMRASNTASSPAVIKAKPAFAGPVDDRTSILRIFADDDGRRVVTSKNGRWTLRESHEKGRAVDLGTLGRREGEPWNIFWARFLPGDKLASFFMAGMHHINLATGDVLRSFDKNPSPWGDHFGVVLEDKKHCVGGSSDSFSIFDPVTGDVIKEIKSQPNSDGFLVVGYGTLAAFTNDSSMMVAVVKNEQFFFLCFWDVNSGKCVGGIELGDDNVTCLAFSPDNKVLAVGHHNRSVSLWDVQAALAGLRPERELIRGNAPKTINKTKVDYEWIDGFPLEKLAGSDGLVWNFHNDGSIQVDEVLPSFGELLCDGEPVVGDNHRFWNQTNGQLGSWFVAMFEGATYGGKIAVSRLLQRSVCFGDGYDSTDGLTNLSPDSQDITVEFRMTFPPGCHRLQTEKKRTIDLSSDEFLKLEDDECWIAASDTFPLTQPFPAIRVRSWSASRPPKIRWEKAAQRLSLEYQVRLRPYETRWLSHGLAFIKCPPGGTLNDFEVPNSADFGHAAGWGEAARGVNFGQIQANLPAAAHAFLRVWGDGRRYESEKDSFGLAWAVTYGGGRRGELGAEQLFAPWMKDRPLGYGTRSLHRGLEIASLSPSASMRSFFRSLDGALELHRMDFSRPDHPVTIWQDTLKNTTSEEKEFHLSYRHSFVGPIQEIVDDKGKVYAFNQLMELNASEVQGCAFVVSGDSKPATLITMNRRDTKVRCTLRRLSDTVFAQDYRVVVGPNSSVALIHAACQRPLRAFKSAEEAFADLLPLRKPQENGKTLDKFRSVRDSIPIVNSPLIEP